MSASADTTAVIAWLVRALAARRVLLIGADDVTRLSAVAAALPPDALLICMQHDGGAAAAARAAFQAGGHTERASVMVGDPVRFLHKLSGPFDLVVQDGSHERVTSTHERVVQLVDATGTLVTEHVSRGGRYNEQLADDARFYTITLNADDGISLSVRL